MSSVPDLYTIGKFFAHRILYFSYTDTGDLDNVNPILQKKHSGFQISHFFQDE